tara:strand:+ start:127 stop:369 length:243 start_codon:yes stop_codon:yes gene_type:complete
MKAQIYLTHNCEAHKKELNYEKDQKCCDAEHIVNDFEMELLDENKNRIEFNVPPSGMEGVNHTLSLWSGQYKEFLINFIK